MQLFIIGSQGFIGSSCRAYFEKKGYQIVCYDRPLPGTTTGSNYYSAATNTLDSILTAHQFDICINAAGSGDVGYSVENPLADFESNSIFTFKILDAIRRFQPGCKYLHISSAAVYGNPLSIPIQEDSRLLPISPYGWHKLLAENICKEFINLYAIPIVIVRPFSVYGPGLRKQLFWDWYIKTKQANGKIELWGSGNESRDFIYIDDLCLCFHHIISKADFQLNIFNVASGIESSIQEAASLYFSACGKEFCFSKKNKEGAPVNWKADITSIKEMGFQPTIDLEKGISNLIEWQRSDG